MEYTHDDIKELIRAGDRFGVVPDAPLPPELTIYKPKCTTGHEWGKDYTRCLVCKKPYKTYLAEFT